MYEGNYSSHSFILLFHIESQQTQRLILQTHKICNLSNAKKGEKLIDGQKKLTHVDRSQHPSPRTRASSVGLSHW